METYELIGANHSGNKWKFFLTNNKSDKYILKMKFVHVYQPCLGIYCIPKLKQIKVFPNITLVPISGNRKIIKTDEVYVSEYFEYSEMGEDYFDVEGYINVNEEMFSGSLCQSRELDKRQ